MGGIFGGGGSSTTTQSSTTVTVNPYTEVNIPVDELAEAIKQSAKEQTEITKAVTQIQTAFKKAELEQEKQFKQIELEQADKTRKSLFFLGALGIGVYLFTKRKR